MRNLLEHVLGPPPVTLHPGRDRNILVLSMRRIHALAAYCMQYEFEDLITELTGADRLDVSALEVNELERKLFKLVRKATPSVGAALWLTPQLNGFRLERTYDLFMPIFNHVYEVYALRSLAGWRQKSRHAVCVISELWEDSLPEYLVESLSMFDRIYVCSNALESVERISGRPCSYFPIGVDAITFSPLPGLPRRGIDVCGIGRRSAVTHEALLKMARGRGAFYYYDTIKATAGVADATRQVTFSVTDHTEHRLKLANLLKRRRYYLASRARANEPEHAAMDEMSGRFFEGAAAGALMLGDPPRSQHYQRLFNWPDAVVQMPFDAPEVVEVLDALDADPQRTARIRRDNVVNALGRLDWAHRLRDIVDGSGLPAPEGLLAREARLRELVDRAKETDFS
jgi:hypothetical protein